MESLGMSKRKIVVLGLALMAFGIGAAVSAEMTCKSCYNNYERCMSTGGADCHATFQRCFSLHCA
jgi:hypothetical protein